jgi:uncharacterized membrane protein YfcA
MPISFPSSAELDLETPEGVSMYALAIALSLLIGLSLGLLGGGGSILTLPILVYALGMDEKAAIAGSLLVVAVTSAVAMVSHARAGRVEWRTGLIFAGAGMLGAFGGGRLAAYIPARLLLLAFTAMMVATAAAMLRGRKDVGVSEKGAVPVFRVLAIGALVGLVAGTVGAGGGFLVVPALVLLGGLDMRRAVGTSLLVISLNSFSGFSGHLGHVSVDYTILALVTLTAVVGSLLGGRLASRFAQETLRRAFGWFVLAMAGFMLFKQLS